MPPRTRSLRTRILLAFVALIILTFSLFGLVQQVEPAAAASRAFASSPRSLSVSPSSFTNCWTCVATNFNNITPIADGYYSFATGSGIKLIAR